MPYRSPVLRVCVCIVFLACCTATIAQENEEVAPPDLRIATGTPDGAYYAFGVVLKLALERDGKYTVEVVETAGSLENCQRLKDSAADFGLIQGALHTPLEDLVAIANIGIQYTHVVVPVNSTYRTFSDLAGKRIGVGPEDSGASALAKLVLNFCNYSPAPEIVHTSWIEVESALREGDIDAAFLVFSLYARYIEAMLATGEFRLLPIRESEALARYIPGARSDTIPPYSYGPNRSMPGDGEAALSTITVNTLLIARPGVSKKNVHAILRALYSIEVIKLAGLSTLTEDTGRTVIDLPLHPAAEDYYTRNDPITSDMFEIASFFLAGLITIVSISHYLRGRIQSRVLKKRRLRIDPYFESLLLAGEKIQSTEDIEVLMEMINTMMSTQRSAEEEWLKGRLDTEHMENLYSVYSTRSANAFQKIFQIQNAGLNEKLAQFAPLVAELARKNNVSLPEGFLDASKPG
ncbi:MAG: TAXI family TRAP transporter solute-binding subunit [Candidatus Hydrogenedentes bacterium]|nr:TAXI family TRAP transporter solute-binding subunit [Candidatus Hydrogenedentota bacterium]